MRLSLSLCALLLHGCASASPEQPEAPAPPGSSGASAPAPSVTAMPVLSSDPVSVAPAPSVVHEGHGDTRMATWSFKGTADRDGKPAVQLELRYTGTNAAESMKVVLYYYGVSGQAPVWNDGTLSVHEKLGPGETREVSLSLNPSKLPPGGRLEAETYEMTFADGKRWSNRNLYDSNRSLGGATHEQLLARHGEVLTGELVKQVDGIPHYRFTNKAAKGVHSYYPHVAFCDDEGQEVDYQVWSSERQSPGFLIPPNGSVDVKAMFTLPKEKFARQIIVVPKVKYEDGAEWTNNNLGHRQHACR
jgi:hypothetical protein